MSGAGRFEPREAPLKDGRRVTIRRVELADLVSYFEMERDLFLAGVGQVRSPDETPDTVEGQEEKLRPWIDGDHSGVKGLQLVAVDERGEIAGAARVRRASPKRVRHNATLSVGVKPSWQGLGVGRALMVAMIDWCRGCSHTNAAAKTGGVTRVDLCVFANNARAIALYESLGFARVGVRHGFVRFEDGRCVDDYLMELML
ncbi:MAG TPA: GNAT family N-acetyltransferase [Phycisphaerales bacterium]|nr:GNAT family N-acetyltransferase [Phycisphaerales bacterium]